MLRLLKIFRLKLQRDDLCLVSTTFLLRMQIGCLRNIPLELLIHIVTIKAVSFNKQSIVAKFSYHGYWIIIELQIVFNIVAITLIFSNWFLFELIVTFLTAVKQSICPPARNKYITTCCNGAVPLSSSKHMVHTVSHLPNILSLLFSIQVVTVRYMRPFL